LSKNAFLICDTDWVPLRQTKVSLILLLYAFKMISPWVFSALGFY